MNPAIETLSRTLAEALGSQLEAIYYFGEQAGASWRKAEFDPNLLILNHPQANIHTLREKYLPLWQEHRSLLKMGPLVATRQSLQRHLQLNPSLALHLLLHGKQLIGDTNPEELFRTSVNPYEYYAYLSQQLLEASTVLGSEAGVNPQAEELLTRLGRQVQSEHSAEAGSAIAQFNIVNSALTAVIAQLPAGQTWIKAAEVGPTSPSIPGLQAIYTENNKNIFVFNQLSPERVQQINWQLLAQSLPQSDATLHITTVAQFCLIALFEKALDLRFNKYEPRWGIHFLAKLRPTAQQILRQAARVPSQILMADLPHSYLTIENGRDDALHKLIHDFQNRMLNIQLENELLFRLSLLPQKFSPPTPLPDPDVPAKDRVEAIFQHLDWWADFYQNRLAAKK